MSDDRLHPEGAYPGASSRICITPQGRDALRRQLGELRDRRPEIVQAVADTAHVGDRSHDVEYHNTRRALSALDERIRQLAERLATSAVVDPGRRESLDQVFFGAAVTYADDAGRQRRVTIVGPDEAEPSQGTISILSPVAKALIGARVGDEVEIETPSGSVGIEILAID